MRQLFFLLCFFVCTSQNIAQELFPKQCEGVWEGTMEIVQNAKLVDRPEVLFTVTPVVKDSIWIWRTDYTSQKYGPISKDYKLILKDKSMGHYILDESNDIYLDVHCVNNKMYSAFEVQNTLLSSSYEFQNGQLVFEVISSPKSTDTTMVVSHPVRNVQRVVLSRKQ